MAYDPYGLAAKHYGLNIDANGTAINPKTGQREAVYAIAPDDPLQGDWSNFKFASEGGLTPQHQALTGWAPGYYTDTPSTFDNFMERGTLGGLMAIGGAAFGGAGLAGEAGAGAGADAGVYGLSGIESAAAPGFTYGTAGAGGTALGGATGAGTLAGTAAAAGPGEWADLSGWLGADASGAPAYDATTASVNDALNAGATGGAAAGATGTGTAGAAAAGGGSALSRLTGGNADMINLAGTLGAAGLGAYGASEYSNRLKEIYDDMASKREPYRQQSLAWLNNPSAYVNGPGAASLDATLRRLSVGGNPVSDPTKLGIATQAGLQNWQSAVTGMANLGLSGEDARANVASNAAGAANDVYANLGAGLGAITRPRRTLADYIGGLF